MPRLSTPSSVAPMLRARADAPYDIAHKEPDMEAEASHR